MSKNNAEDVPRYFLAGPLIVAEFWMGANFAWWKTTQCPGLSFAQNGRGNSYRERDAGGRTSGAAGARAPPRIAHQPALGSRIPAYHGDGFAAAGSIQEGIFLGASNTHRPRLLAQFQHPCCAIERCR